MAAWSLHRKNFVTDRGEIVSVKEQSTASSPHALKLVQVRHVWHLLSQHAGIPLPMLHLLLAVISWYWRKFLSLPVQV